MQLTPRLKLAAAVTRIVDGRHGWMPYFHAALTGLIRVESTDVPTLAVSKFGVLYWNAAWVDSHTVEIVAMGLAHETMHVMLRHHERAEALGIRFEPGAPVSEDMQIRAQLANLAEDACINEQLRAVQVPQDKGGEAVLPLPAEWIYPETLKQPAQLVMEDRYRRLVQNPPPPPPPSGGGGGAGAPKPGKGKGDGEGGVGQGKCGSCSGNPTKGEPAGSKAQGEGRSEAEMDRMRRQVASDVRTFASKGRGTLPAGLERWADDMLTAPKVDWRTQLAQAIRASIAYRAGSVSLTWQRPSRRQGGLGYGIGVPILPALHAPVPLVAVVCDTSGSMGQGQGTPLAAAASEIRGVLRDVGAKITIVGIDADVHAIRDCATIEEACGTLKGGGGTDMTPAFTALADRKPRPEVVIVLTDGYIGDGHPAVEPDWCRTVWCVVGENTERCCPWGEWIHVDSVGAEEAV
jgi:predicted metal-dependent peptidase